MQGEQSEQMSTGQPDLLARYLRFSQESCALNDALSATEAIETAFRDCVAAQKRAHRLNDLQLFLLQVAAFDGFVTAYLHRRRMSLEGSLTKRVRCLVSEALKMDKAYQVLESTLSEISMVRDAWMHGQGDPSITKRPTWPPHLEDKFGLYKEDDRLWICLSHRPQRGVVVWTLIIRTLHDLARKIWGSR